MCPAPKGNQYAVGNKGGRPPIFKTVQELDQAINEYFESCFDQTETDGVKR